MSGSASPVPSLAADPPLRWSPRHPDLVAVILLLLLTLPWWWAVKAPLVALDDPIYITNNPEVLAGITPHSIGDAFASTRGSLWIPMTWLSLMLDVSLYHGGPGGMHATNVLLHIANTVLFYGFLRQATDRPARSFLAAALFSMHPLRVESVAWVTERKDVLALFFGLWSLLAYLSYVRATGAATRLVWLTLACIAHALGLMSKPMLVTLPCVLLLLDAWPLRRWSRWSAWRLLLEKIPFFALSLAASVITTTIQKSQGAMVGTDVYPLMLRLRNVPVAYALYVRDQVYFGNLSVFYPALHGITAGEVAGALVLLAGITLFALWRARDRAPAVLIGWLWFLGALLPVSGLFQSGGQSRADRFTYFPALGLAIAVAWLVPASFFAAPGTAAVRRALAGACAALCILVLTFFTVLRLDLWRDPLRLYTTDIARTGGHNWMLEYLAAQTVQQSGDIEGAIAWYRRAVADSTRIDDARYQLALLLEQTGRKEEALRYYWEAGQIKPDDERYRAHFARLLEELQSQSAPATQR